MKVISHRVDYADAAHRARRFGQHDLAARYDVLERKRRAAIGVPMERVFRASKEGHPSDFIGYVLRRRAP